MDDKIKKLRDILTMRVMVQAAANKGIAKSTDKVVETLGRRLWTGNTRLGSP